MISKVLAFIVLLAFAGQVLGGGIGIGGYGAVDLYAPPKYEFEYAVKDPHTGDNKQQGQVRIGELTKDEYTWAEPDRVIRVGKIIAGGAPLIAKGYGGYGGY